eukprot:7347916-Pyramimonas_sp.AAC.1
MGPDFAVAKSKQVDSAIARIKKALDRGSTLVPTDEVQELQNSHSIAIMPAVEAQPLIPSQEREDGTVPSVVPPPPTPPRLLRSVLSRIAANRAEALRRRRARDAEATRNPIASINLLGEESRHASRQDVEPVQADLQWRLRAATHTLCFAP